MTLEQITKLNRIKWQLHVQRAKLLEVKNRLRALSIHDIK